MPMSLPLQPFKSLRKRVKADIRGLSCMLLPFLPRSPHRPARASSPEPSFMLAAFPSPFSMRCIASGFAAPPPKMADTEDWAQRACLRMAEVTVMHSVTTSATGSIEADIARVRGWNSGTPCSAAWIEESGWVLPSAAMTELRRQEKAGVGWWRVVDWTRLFHSCAGWRASASHHRTEESESARAVGAWWMLRYLALLRSKLTCRTVARKRAKTAAS